jgi:hypothetical protein
MQCYGSTQRCCKGHTHALKYGRSCGLFDGPGDQAKHLTWFGMPVSLEFGVNQPAIHGHLELAPIGGHQGQIFDLEFIILEQFVRQAHGPVCIMSDSAINDFNRYHLYRPPKVYHSEQWPDCFLTVYRCRGAQNERIHSMLENYNMHPARACHSTYQVL